MAQKAEVVYQADTTNEVELQNYIKELGFGAEILEASAGEHFVEIRVSFAFDMFRFRLLIDVEVYLEMLFSLYWMLITQIYSGQITTSHIAVKEPLESICNAYSFVILHTVPHKCWSISY